MLTVVCKATFLLNPNQTATLVSPEAPAIADTLWHRDSQSIGVPTDLVPFKRNVDVLLIGHAYAPQRRPTASLLVGLSVGTFAKSILVTGDRSWEPNGTCPEPEPFVRTPLCWERAAGGPSTWNPIGVPVGARIDPRTRPRIPNLLPRGFVPQNYTHLIPPVGFGALAPHWPARAAYVQKWAASWNHAKWYEGLLPQELDAVYFNAAPTDQQLRELPETTQITLDHLHPDLPRLVSMVDDIRPRALITRTPGTAPQELWLRADTLLIDVDRVTCSISWRATMALRHPQEDGVIYVEPTRGLAAPTPVKANAALPFQNATSVPPVSTPMPLSAATNPPPTNRPSTPDSRRDNPLMSMPVDEFTTLPLRNEPQPPSSASPLPFRPPAPSGLNFRADDDEVTAIHAQPKRLTPPPEPATPPAPPASSAPRAPLSGASRRIGKTLIPDTPASTEAVLPFRPVPQAAEDPSSARNRFAALSASSVLPFQTPNTPSEAPAPRERLPSVPPASAFTVPVPPARPSAPSSAPVPLPPPAPLPIAPAPLSSSGLPFQTPPASEAPPPPRDRLPSVPPTGLPFGVPLGATPPPPAAPPVATPFAASGLPFQTPPTNEAPSPPPPVSAPLATSGLPFQTPPTNEAPPPPRDRLPSVPPTGSLFGAALGQAPPSPPAPPVATPLAASGLPFQTTSTNDAPPPRERLPSVSLVGTPFSAPLQPAPPISPAISSPLSMAGDTSWPRLSGPSDEIKPTLQPQKSDTSATPKPKSELSFERYARIKVHLWSPDASREDVLQKHGIDEVEWRILEQQQTEALELEAKEGRCDLALALVAAFEAANAPSLAAP